MFDKLEDLLVRLEEILSELQEPDVANDQNRFRKLMKEQNELTPIVEAYKEYKECKQAIEDSLQRRLCLQQKYIECICTTQKADAGR